MIELIMVIVILGILAAVAIPRFVDLSEEAGQAAVDGVAGAMGSAMAINYAACSAKGHTPDDKCVAIANCNEVGTILVGGLPGGYSVDDVDLDSDGATEECTVTGPDHTATFQGIGAGQS